MSKQTLDFLVIGAMRSGTTTLHELLKQHPGIYLPAGKEIPYFADNTSYALGMKAYLKNNFSKARPHQKLGTISPSYMYNLSNISTDEVARRIKKEAPNVKLIAILRHPIERAYSHYNFARRNGFTDMDFETSIKRTLGQKGAQSLGSQHEGTYLARSLYGACLAPFYNHFKAKNILILYLDDLEGAPAQTLKRIYEFIGVDKTFLPVNIGRVFHQGGAQAKIPWLTPGNLMKHKLLRRVVRAVLPYHIRKRIEMWLLVWNSKPQTSKLSIDKNLYHQLITYFRGDIKDLERLTRQRVPWTDWH